MIEFLVKEKTQLPKKKLGSIIIKARETTRPGISRESRVAEMKVGLLAHLYS